MPYHWLTPIHSCPPPLTGDPSKIGDFFSETLEDQWPTEDQFDKAVAFFGISTGNPIKCQSSRRTSLSDKPHVEEFFSDKDETKIWFSKAL